SADETANAARRLFERLGREQPLVVIFDDVHWAEPAFLDLVDHVVEWSSQSPILVICTARPDLLDTRPGWGGGKVNASTVLLEPLDQEASEELIANVVGGSLEPALSKQILQSAEGNPLFVEEMVSMLVDDGALTEDGGVWRIADPDQVRVPTSLRVLLAARLDRLGSGERQVISRAAVVGKVFERQAVTALAPEELRNDVSQHLGTLSRRELIRPDTGSDDLFTFRHILIRDAAYDALPKRDRAELHERFAAWLEADLGSHVAEYEEILGYHLEQAFESWRDIGEQRADLSTRAATLLASAGVRATVKSDNRSALSLLGRARSLMNEDDPEIANLTFHLVKSHTWLGDLDMAKEEARLALESARRRGDRRAEAWAVLGDSYASMGEHTSTEHLRRLHDAAETMDEHGDLRGLVEVWDAISAFQNYVCLSRESIAGVHKAAAYARELGDERREIEALANALWRGLWGHVRPEELLRQAAELEPRIPEGGSDARLVDEVRAASLALLDRIPEALEMAELVAERSKQFAIMTQVVGCQVRSTVWVRGDLERGRAELEWSDGILKRMGEMGARSSTSAMLADVAHMIGDLDRAETAIATCREITVDDDFDALARANAVECKLLALRGDDRAIEVGRRAIEISEPTEYLLMRPRVLTLVAEAHALLGDAKGAADLYRRARAVADEKGDLWTIRRIDEALAQPD
ncbi:MAG: hypothetical protein QOH26_1561, partial [Actinomycetota bacterium]|nr:hypothetical protein [Actinomycetota bacterium]